MLQSVLVAAVLYTVLYVSVIVIQRGTLPKSPTELIKNPVDTAPGSSPVHGGGESAGTALPPHVKVEKINPHANWFNRPESLVVPNDDYMGKRPHIDTVANVTLLVEQCRGSYEHLEKMAHVDDCMRYLAEGEKEYYYLPPSDKRASAQSPKNAEYLNADGHDNSLDAILPTRPQPRLRSVSATAPLSHTTSTGLAQPRGEWKSSSSLTFTRKISPAHASSSGWTATASLMRWNGCSTLTLSLPNSSPLLSEETSL